MGRLSSTHRAIVAAVITGAATLALAGCENSLMTYLFKGIFYQGWKVASWSTPAPVVETETVSHGFPMNMAMGSNGKLHVVGWRVNAKQWIHTSMEPGAESFDQPFTVMNSTNNPDGFMPGIDLVSADQPIVVYGVYDGFGNHDLYYQQYDNVGETWLAAQPIDSNSSNDEYAPAFVFLFSSDLKPHIWYLSGGSIYHTVRMTQSAIDPDPPVEWLSDVGNVAAVRLDANDVAFAYTDVSDTQLFYRAWTGSSSTPIWRAPADIEIGGISLTLDSNGAVYVCLGAYKPSDDLNPAFYTLHIFTNAGGSWQELESIAGDASAGPLPTIPIAIDIAPDRYGNDHLHMAYTVYTPPYDFSIWYTYYEESKWHAPQRIDTVNTNVVYPLIAVDPTGIVHVTYSWWKAELTRIMMYVRGTPAEPQNQ
jgi:hypothetical protein